MTISEMRKALAKIAGILAVVADMKVYANSEGTSFTIAKRATADYPLLVKDVGDDLVEAIIPAVDQFEANLKQEAEEQIREAAENKAAELKEQLEAAKQEEEEQETEQQEEEEPKPAPRTRRTRRTRRTSSK